MFDQEKRKLLLQRLREQPQRGLEVTFEFTFGMLLLETLRVRSRGDDTWYRYHIECSLAWFKEHDPFNGATVPLNAVLTVLPSPPPNILPPVAPHQPTLFEEWTDFMSRKKEDK